MTSLLPPPKLLLLALPWGAEGVGLISRDSAAATFLRTRFQQEAAALPVTAVGGTSLATPAFPLFLDLVNLPS